MTNERKACLPRRARMTYRKFLKILKGLGKEWKLDSNGQIRLFESRSDVRGCNCPAVVVVKAITGVRFSNKHFDSALESIGVCLRNSDYFANGADNILADDNCDHRLCWDRCVIASRFRNGLLKATGLWKEAQKREKNQKSA